MVRDFAASRGAGPEQERNPVRTLVLGPLLPNKNAALARKSQISKPPSRRRGNLKSPSPQIANAFWIPRHKTWQTEDAEQQENPESFNEEARTHQLDRC